MSQSEEKFAKFFHLDTYKFLIFQDKYRRYELILGYMGMLLAPVAVLGIAKLFGIE